MGIITDDHIGDRPSPEPAGITIHVTTDVPMEFMEGVGHYGVTQFQGDAAEFVRGVVARDGGSFGDTMLQAFRFYNWYMKATDSGQVFTAPYGKVSPEVQDSLGIKRVELA